MRIQRMTKHISTQNWFAVALDFIVVVMGVGVALVGQQWLAQRQDRAELVRAEAALQTDLFGNYYIARERVGLSTCRREAMQVIAARLLEPGEDWTPMPRGQTDTVYRNALPILLRSPVRNRGSSIWEAELARGTFNQMDDERRYTLDVIFRQTRAAEALQDDIFTLQSRLKALAAATRIGPEDRLRYYDLLAELDDKSALLELLSGQIAGNIEAVGVNLSDEESRNAVAGLAQTNAGIIAVYGDCFDPVTMPFLDAAPEDGQPQ